MKNMYKIFIIIIMSFMFIFSVKGAVFSNYDNAVSNTNSYITKFNNYKLYIDDTNKYLYNGTLGSKSGFVNGGFINTYEFSRTFKNNDSYLITGSRYFTMTDNGNNVDIVDLRSIASKSKSENYESRITEYVRYFIKVKGEGTRNNPWVFISDYTFNVTFNPMGGIVVPSTKKVKILEKYGDLPTPIRVGYNFKGWYFESNYVKQLNSEDIVEITNDITVYAKWEIKKYNVVLNVTNGSGNPASTIINHFDNAVFNVTPNTNYEFTGSSVTCNNGAKGSLSGNTVTISNVTNDTTCSISATPMYYCPVGTLAYSGGSYICVSGPRINYGTNSCEPCKTYEVDYEDNCNICGEITCVSNCNKYSGSNKQDCIEACWICGSCSYGCKSCTKTRRSCSKCPDTYYCPDGWNVYSGSGSSLRCYTQATKK